MNLTLRTISRMGRVAHTLTTPFTSTRQQRCSIYYAASASLHPPPSPPPPSSSRSPSPPSPPSSSSSSSSASPLVSPSDSSSFVVSTVGPDRANLLRDVSKEITAVGGNIDQARMSLLGGQFICGMRITTPKTVQAEALTSSLQRLLPSFTVDIRPAGSAAQSSPFADVDRIRHVYVDGKEQPGVLKKLTDIFAKHKINIRELTIDHDPVIDGQPANNHLHAEVEFPDTVDEEQVGTALFKLEQSTGLQIAVETDAEPQGGEDEEYDQEHEEEEEEEPQDRRQQAPSRQKK